MNQICNFIIYDMHAKSCEFYTLNAAPFSANTSKNTDSDGQKIYETYHLCQGLSLPASVEPLDVQQKNRKSSVGWKHPLRKTLVNHVPHKPLPFTLGILLGTSTHGDGERKATLLDSKDEGHEDVVGGSKGILLRLGPMGLSVDF